MPPAPGPLALRSAAAAGAFVLAPAIGPVVGVAAAALGGILGPESAEAVKSVGLGLLTNAAGSFLKPEYQDDAFAQALQQAMRAALQKIRNDLHAGSHAEQIHALRSAEDQLGRKMVLAHSDAERFYRDFGFGDSNLTEVQFNDQSWRRLDCWFRMLLHAEVRNGVTTLSIVDPLPELPAGLLDTLKKKLPAALDRQLNKVLAEDKHKAAWVSAIRREFRQVQERLGRIERNQAVQEELLTSIDGKLPVTGGGVAVAPSWLTPSDARLTPLTDFFGRAEIVDEVGQALRADENRPVNIHGSPGIGKTEVAKAVIRSWLQTEGHRALLISLRGVDTETGMAGAILDAFGLPPAARLDQIRAIPDGGPLLIYLDNFEDAQAIAQAPLNTLRGVPGGRLLVTCRNQLGPNWRNLAITRLATPAAMELFQSLLPAPVSETDVLRKFVEAKLSGHPLSIKLTASQADAYGSLRELIEDWERDALSLMEMPADGIASDEERSWRVSVERSYRRVSETGRELWLLLALCPEGINPELWDELARRAERGTDYRRAFAELRRANLAEEIADGESRGTKTQLVPLMEWRKDQARRDGGDGLTAADREVVERLIAIFHAWKDGADAAALSERAGVARGPVERQLRNWRSVVEFARNRDPDGTLGDRLLESLSGVGNIGFGAPREYLALIESLQAVAERRGRNWDLAVCCERRGGLERQLGNRDAARDAYDRALPLFKQISDPFGQANVWLGLGDLELQLGDHVAAREAFDRALPLYEQIGDPRGQAYVRLSRGDLELQLGNLEAARAAFDRALPLYMRLNEPRGITHTHFFLALLEAFQNGRPKEAGHHLREALRWSLQSGIAGIEEQLRELAADRGINL